MSLKKRKLLIFGTGTLGELAGYYFKNDSDYDLLAYVNNLEFIKVGSLLQGKPVLTIDEATHKFDPTEVDFFIAIGYRKTNSIRQERYMQIKGLGYKCTSYISSRATVLSDEIGENCFILENNVIQPFTRIGNNVTMWSGNHLGHHSIVEDNVFITSHVVVSGKCRLGANSFFGVNCCLYDSVHVGEKSVIAAGAIVSESCQPRSVIKPLDSKIRNINRDII